MSPVLLTLIPEITKAGIDLFNKHFETDSDKLKAQRDFELLTSVKIQEAFDKEQEQLTLRHSNDMNSDSKLSKNIRPLSLLYLMALFTLAFFMQVPEQVLLMLRDLLMTVFVFYFGSRTLEKVTSMIKGGNAKR